MADDFDDGFEPDGLTLGPEARLEREIAKTKALKVQRLQLQDRIARLEDQLQGLTRENEQLKTRGQVGTDKGTSQPVWNPSTLDSIVVPKAGRCGWGGWIAAGLVAVATLSLYWFWL